MSGGGVGDWTVPAWLHGIADPVRLAVLSILNEAGEVTVGDLAQRCRTSRRTVNRHLKAMVALGLVAERQGESDGLTSGRPPTRFRLAPPIQEEMSALLSPGGSPEGRT